MRDYYIKVEDLILWDSFINSFMNNPYKFAILDLELPAKSKFVILVKFCLRFLDVLDKIL